MPEMLFGTTACKGVRAQQGRRVPRSKQRCRTQRGTKAVV